MLIVGIAVFAFAVSHARQGTLDAPIGGAAPGTPRFIGAASSLAPDAIPDDVGHLTFMSPHASPIAVNGGSVFVANTPADTVDVIDAASRTVTARVRVGVDPVGLAVRPDGKEVWVANHVSDSVSVIDADPASLTYLQVVATVQEIGTFSGATRFDEPVGIAFASDEKAYVALSSENQVAIVDVAARRVTRYIDIRAQDPRAIAVRGERLYVIPFESNNRTQISGCRGEIDGELCTFDAQEHVVDNNNVLSLGITVDVVKHPDVPDRDLYVFDTTTDALVEVVDTVGTLLYGLRSTPGARSRPCRTDASRARKAARGHALRSTRTSTRPAAGARSEVHAAMAPNPVRPPRRERAHGSTRASTSRAISTGVEIHVTMSSKLHDGGAGTDNSSASSHSAAPREWTRLTNVASASAFSISSAAPPDGGASARPVAVPIPPSPLGPNESTRAGAVRVSAVATLWCLSSATPAVPGSSPGSAP